VIGIPAPRLALAAPVSGFAAFVITKVLEESMPRRLVALQDAVVRGKLHPDLLADVVAQWAAVQEAGAVWSQWRASADGSAEAIVTEMPAGSTEIDTSRAADLMGVTPSRVRQLARNGALPGRKVASTWLLDRTSVELRKECNGGKFR
jgi:hypothetical protein